MTQNVVGDFIDGRIQKDVKVIKKCRPQAEQNAGVAKWLEVAGADVVLEPINESTYDEQRDDVKQWPF